MNAMMVIKVQILANQATKQLQSLNAQMAATQGMAGRGAAGVGKFNQALSLQSLSKWGSQLQWAGRQLTYNFTMPLALAAGAATKWALDNEKSWTRVQKVYGNFGENTTAEIKALDSSMEMLSEKFGVQRKAVNEIAGDWAAAGAAGVGLANGVNETLRVMVLGELEAAEATEALIAVQAQYGLSTEQLTTELNTLNMVENETGAQMGDLIVSLSKSAGTARSAGIDMRHLAAMTAALVPASGSAANAGNGLKTIISRLLSPTGQAAELMEQMGVNVKDMSWQTLNGAQRLEAMSKAFVELDDAQKAVVSTYVAGRYQINRFDVLMMDMANTQGYYNKALAASEDPEKNRLQAYKELNAVLQSQPKQLERLWVTMQNGLSKAVGPLIPAILWVMRGISDMAKTFGDADPRLQKLVISIILAVAALGLLTTLIGAFATAVATLLKPLRIFIALGVLMKGAWGTGIVVAIRNVIAALVAFSMAIGPRLIAGFLTGIGFILKQFIVLNAMILRTSAMMIVGLAMKPIRAIIGAWSVGGLGGLLAIFRTFAVNAIRMTWTVVTATTGALSTAGGALAGGFGKMSAMMSRFFAPILALFAPIGTAVFTLMASIAAGVTTMFTTGFAGLAAYPAYLAPIGAALTGVWASIVTAMGTISAWFATQWATVTTKIPTLLAAIGGPIAGAWATIMNGLGAISAWFATQWTILVSRIPMTLPALGAALAGAWAAIMNGLGVITAWFATQWTIITTKLPGIIAGVGPAIAKAWSLMLVFMRNAWMVTMTFMTTTLPTFLARFTGFFALVGKGWGMLMTGMAGGMASLGGFIKKAAMMLGRFMLGPWGLALSAIITLVAIFWDEIKDFFAQFQAGWAAQAGGIAKAFQPLAGWFNNIVAAVQRAFNKLPEGVQGALMSVVSIVKNAALKVYEWFGYMNPFKRHSPSLVESVTWGMAEVRKQYASVGNASAPFKKAAADLKAFKTIAQGMGVDEFSDQRSDVAEFMPSNLGNFNALVGHLKTFKSLLVEQGNAVNDQEAVVKGWKDQLDAANKSLKTQTDIMDKLKGSLDGLQEMYDQHEANVDAFASAAVKGTRKYSDALFENEQAQKRLQLALLDLKKVDTEDAQNQMADLRGEIEALQGTVSDLSFAGAGSDVTGPIKDQIKAMEKEYNKLGSGSGDNPNGQIDALEKQLASLQTEAERMSLIESLELDPLRRKIEQLADTSKELTFEEITTGIHNEQAAMAALNPQIAAATTAYEAQKANVDQLTAARDVLEATYDGENEKLQVLRDEYAMTEQAIRDIEQALNDVSGQAKKAGEALKEAKGGKDGSGALSPAMENFLAAEGANFEDVGGDFTIGREGDLGDIEDFNKQLEDELAGMMGEFDMFGPIREKWDQFTAWWRATVTPAWDGLVSGLSGVFGSISFEGFEEKFNGIKDKVSPTFEGIGETVTGAWEGIKKWGGELWDIFGPKLEDIWNNLTAAIGPAIDKIVEKLGPAWEAFKKAWSSIMPILGVVFGSILAVLGGLISGILTAIGNVIGPVIDVIGAIISSVIQIATGIWNTMSGIFDVIVGVVQGIIGFFKGVFTGDWTGFQAAMEKIWGGIKSIFQGISEILGGIWSAVWQTIDGLIKVVVGAVSGFVTGIIDWFVWLWDVLVGHSIVPDMVNAIIDWFVKLWEDVSKWVADLVNGVVQWFQDLWDSAVEKFNGFMDGVKSAWDAMGNALKEVWAWIEMQVFDKIKEGAGWVADKFAEVKDNVKKSWDTMGTNLTNFWNNLRDNIFDKIKEAAGWVSDKFEAVKNSVKTSWDTMSTNLMTFWNNLRDNIFDKIKEAVGWVGDKFVSVKNGIVTAWDLMKQGVEGVWTYLRDNVFNRFKEGVEAIGTTFESVKTIIGTAWGKIKGAAAAPVNFIIDTVYNNGIKKVWNDIADAVGLDLKLPSVEKIDVTGLSFANGTEDHRAQIARGGSMRVWAEPETGGEAYIPLAAHKRGQSAHILKQVASRFGYGLTQYDNGGFWDSVGGAVSNAGKWIKDAAVNVGNFISDPVNGIKDMISKPVETLMETMGGGGLGARLMELPRKVISSLITKAKEMITGGGATGAGEDSAAIPGGVLPTISGPWQRPMKGGRVTSEFGNRFLFGRWALHNGIDLAGGGNTYATWAGRVARTGNGAGYGNTGLGILIDHSNGLQSYYGHNPIGGIQVRAGQMVAAGQHIGKEGSTGQITGRHLHYSIFRNGQAINPRQYGVFDQGGVLQPGGVAHNLSNQPEVVFNAYQWGLMSKLLRVSTAQGTDSIQRATTVNQTFNFYGNLEFPNVRDGDDADNFINNLTDLAGVS